MEFTWYGCTSSNNCPPRRIDNYSFIYVVTGCGTLRTDKNSFHINKEDLFVLFPDEIHEYYTCKDNTWNLLWFGVTGKDIADLIKHTGLQKSNPVAKSSSNRFIYDTIKEIIRLLDKDSPGNNIFALGKFLELLGHLHNCLANHQEFSSNPMQRIQQAIHFIEYNFLFDIDTDTLAKRARTYFSALFKEHTGKTPMEFLIDTRLEKAHCLLRETSLPIKEISNSTGYNDPFYFTKAFKKRFGCNPSQFRKHIHICKY